MEKFGIQNIPLSCLEAIQLELCGFVKSETDVELCKTVRIVLLDGCQESIFEFPLREFGGVLRDQTHSVAAFKSERELIFKTCFGSF